MDRRNSINGCPRALAARRTYEDENGWIMKNRMSKRTAATIGCVAALALMTVSAPASAAERHRLLARSGSEVPVTQVQSVMDPALFLQGLEELEASSAPRDTRMEQGRVFYEYVVPEGSLTLPSAADVRSALDADANGSDLSPADETSPLLDVRFSGIKVAVGFNTTDQQALLGGAGVAVGAALCLIPGVGPVACTTIGLVITVATTYLAANGICGDGRTLWWYDVEGGSVINCRSSAPF
jgi:hypothetical protein